jgi:hypothetical protein
MSIWCWQTGSGGYMEVIFCGADGTGGDMSQI